MTVVRFHLSNNFIDTEMCADCHHMTVEKIESTIFDDDGVYAPMTLRTLCEECHAEGEY